MSVCVFDLAQVQQRANGEQLLLLLLLVQLVRWRLLTVGPLSAVSLLPVFVVVGTRRVVLCGVIVLLAAL